MRAFVQFELLVVGGELQVLRDPMFSLAFGLRQQGIIYSFVCGFCARRAQKPHTKKMVYHSAEG
jgi:hypothetical protein